MTTTRLGDLLVRIEAGRSFGSTARAASGDEWGIIKVSSMTWGEFRPAENKVVAEPDRVNPRYEIRPGDVLVSRANTADYVGAPVLVRATRPKLLLSDKSLRLVPKAGVDPAYLAAMLSAPQARRCISEMATGTKDSMRNISQAALLSVEMPTLPALNRQRMIVDILDEHVSRLDAGIALLTSATRRLGSLRASAYAQVFCSATGRPATLGEVAKWGSGGTPKTSQPNYYGGSIPWVVSGDLKDRPLGEVTGRITDDGLRASSAKWVPPNSVLVAMYGATIGKAAVTTQAVTTNQAVAHAVPIHETLSPDYLFWFLLSERPRLIRAGQGGAQPNISQTVLKNWPVVVPTVADQKKMVDRLTSLTEGIDRQLTELQTVDRRGQLMRRALRQAAFSGGLTSGAVDDKMKELASEL